MLARLRKKSGPGIVPATTHAMDGLDSEASERPSTGPKSSDPTSSATGRGGIEGKTIRAVKNRQDEASTRTGPCLGDGEPIRATGGATTVSRSISASDDAPIDPPAETSGDRANRPDDSIGVASVEGGGSRLPRTPRSPDGGGIRATLARFGNEDDFDADTSAWRRVHQAGGMDSAPGRSGKHVAGIVNYFLDAIARAKPPEEWELCPRCGGSGRDEVGRGPCESCFHAGYLIDTLRHICFPDPKP
jgi:hypothetical protein